jgi:methylglutaconyl-CoA hydratase
MSHVKSEVIDRILYVKLSRPEKRNAFHPEMIAELTGIFKTAGTGLARMLILSSEGESFCAGGDLEWMKSMAEFSFEENKKDSEALFDMFQAARVCPLPIIGHVHGHVFGGGLGLLAICDIVAAEKLTQFCFSEVKWGLVPAVISPFVLTRMNSARAREWMLTAKIFTAAEAREAGLVHFVGEGAEVEHFIVATRKSLLRAGPESITETKKLLRFLEENQWANYRERCTTVISERRASAEGQAGLHAFLNNTKTTWS